MSFTLVIPRKAQKDIDRIDEKYRKRILVALKSLEENPYLGKKLGGKYKDQRSYEVRPYRIIYQLMKKELVNIIIRVGHRQGIYND